MVLLNCYFSTTWQNRQRKKNSRRGKFNSFLFVPHFETEVKINLRTIEMSQNGKKIGGCKCTESIFAHRE